MVRKVLAALGLVCVSVVVVLATSSANDSDTAAAAEYPADRSPLVDALLGMLSPEPTGPHTNMVGTIPAEPLEFAMRPRLPLCGAEPPKGLTARRDLVARRCLLRAWRHDMPAELVSVSPSIEGPFLVIYRVIGDGTVEALSNDAPWGQGPLRKICGRLRVSLAPSERAASGYPDQPTGIRASRCERADTWG